MGVSDHQLTIWERKDWPSILIRDTLNPHMSSMVGARSMFKTGAWRRWETRRDQIKSVCSKFRGFLGGYLHYLVGCDSRSTDQERDPDVELVELPLIDGQRELTWAQRRQRSSRERGSGLLGRRSRRRRRRRGSDLCGSRCPRCRRCRCCSAHRCSSASLPAFPPCRPQRPASATCRTGQVFIRQLGACF